MKFFTYEAYAAEQDRIANSMQQLYLSDALGSATVCIRGLEFTASVRADFRRRGEDGEIELSSLDVSRIVLHVHTSDGSEYELPVDEESRAWRSLSAEFDKELERIVLVNASESREWEPVEV